MMKGGTHMPRISVDKSLRRAILEARRMIQEAEKLDCNEADTRRRIEQIFENLMGYDALRHLSRELAVRGAGETEHVDFAVQLEEGEDAKPVIMVEIKRVNVALASKHLRQASSYAINSGCEWILLTNSKEWKLYHVSYGQPPVTRLIHSWNVLTDDVSTLAERFKLISLRSVKKGVLDDIWQKTSVLHPRNLLQALLSETSLKLLRRELRKSTDVLLAPEEVVGGIRRLLNEAALAEMEDIKVSLSERKPKKRRSRSRENARIENARITESTSPNDSFTPDDAA